MNQQRVRFTPGRRVDRSLFFPSTNNAHPYPFCPRSIANAQGARRLHVPPNPIRSRPIYVARTFLGVVITWIRKNQGTGRPPAPENHWIALTRPRLLACLRFLIQSLVGDRSPRKQFRRGSGISGWIRRGNRQTGRRAD